MQKFSFSDCINLYCIVDILANESRIIDTGALCYSKYDCMPGFETNEDLDRN